jgi:hypothetical protein
VIRYSVRSDLSIAPRCPVIRHSVRSDLRHSVGMTYLLDARVMALGQQVTPTESRSLHCPRAIERTLLRSVAIHPLPWVGFEEAIEPPSFVGWT